MKWTHSTRGKFRQGTSNVRFSDCRFERSPAINGQTPCMSGPGGGPQGGHAPDGLSTNFVVERCYIEATGDDCVGIFNMDNVRIEDCVFRDSFARGILWVDSTNVRITGNTFVSRGPIKIEGDPPADTIAPAVPTGLGASSVGDVTTLSWDANTEPDFHYYQIYRSLDGVWWEYAITTDTSYEDVWAYAGQDLSYYIQAVDFAGNHSEATAPTATVPCDSNTGDFNDDCVVDLLDLEMMAAHWLQPVFTECPQCDINADGDINLEDFSALSQNWLLEF